MNKLRKYPTYRNAVHTQSILTITSNVVYGKATGNTPDGRRRGEPFAPGANPMHGRDTHGIHASAASVAKIPYRDAADGISLTATLVPEGLGRVAEDRIDESHRNARRVLRQHRLSHERERAESRHPSRCDGASRRSIPNLTIRVSGYAVNFVRLTREQQMDVINRTFHGGGRPMPEDHEAAQDSLEANSPFELRVNLGKDVPESDVRTALATGDMGFLHSFTTGSTVDGPGVRVVAWTTGCMLRCLYCHNPDTWTMTNGIPVTLAKSDRTSCANTGTV